MISVYLLLDYLSTGAPSCWNWVSALSGKTIQILLLTDHTDCTDFFARATCFITMEMTDFTDFVSIACSLCH